LLVISFWKKERSAVRNYRSAVSHARISRFL
jgi:hypothetical protein